MIRITQPAVRLLQYHRAICALPASRYVSAKSLQSNEPAKDDTKLEANAEQVATTQKSTQTIAERDAEIQRKLAGISGDGGESGVEYEDGKPAAMKRSVKNNMFRLI